MPCFELAQEELGVDALAHQPALHVGEGDDDGVDRAGLDVVAQLMLGKHVGILYEIRRLDTASGKAGK